jgi:putative transcriptional regulator
MPMLFDPNFCKTITLICEHSAEHGAMGIVLNQPTSISISELIQLDEYMVNKEALSSLHIYAGGPVDTQHGFILHDCPRQRASSIQVADSLFLTTSTDILEEIAFGQGPENKIIALGYAGWSAGQLEAEILANSWLTTDYNFELVFQTPTEMQWFEAGRQLGIDLNLLNSQPGHA